MNKIIIIEDDIQLTIFMKTLLERESYEVTVVHSGQEGLKEISLNNYSLAILDVKLPDIDGNDVCRKVREFSDIPVIMFSAQSKVNEKVECLDAGANDYIVKPVEVPELLARVRVYLREKTTKKIIDENIFTFKSLKLNFATRETFNHGELIHLSPKEFEILSFFIRNPYKTLSKKDIFEVIWKQPFNHLSDKRVIDEHINNLRRKIHFDDKEKLIYTIYGVGYILK